MKAWSGKSQEPFFSFLGGFCKCLFPIELKQRPRVVSGGVWRARAAAAAASTAGTLGERLEELQGSLVSGGRGGSRLL